MARPSSAGGGISSHCSEAVSVQTVLQCKRHPKPVRSASVSRDGNRPHWQSLTVTSCVFPAVAPKPTPVMSLRCRPLALSVAPALALRQVLYVHSTFVHWQGCVCSVSTCPCLPLVTPLVILEAPSILWWFDLRCTSIKECLLRLPPSDGMYAHTDATNEPPSLP